MSDSSDRSAPALRIRIDTQRCQGHNRCHSLAPDLFDADDYGQSVLRSGVALTPELLRRARLAAVNCPELAIHIDEEGAPE